VQDAVDALDTSSSSAQCIFINEGTYKEQVYIKSLKGALTLYGYTEDDTSYSGNTVTITYGGSQADGSTNDETAALRAWTAGFSVYNINIVNSYGSGSQAVALSAAAATQGYYGCSFQGFQDTVLANTGTQVYAKCEIVGATDFIFGQTAVAWFDSVDIKVLEASRGYVTANGRDSDSNPSYYVFNKATIAAADGNTVKAGAYYLGRPWRNYARVIFQYTEMSDVVNSAGWAEWGSSDTRTDNVYFGEVRKTPNVSPIITAVLTHLSTRIPALVLKAHVHLSRRLSLARLISRLCWAVITLTGWILHTSPRFTTCEPISRGSCFFVNTFICHA
jgi:pectinesterase